MEVEHNMKFITIAIFVLLLNVSMTLINEIDVFDSAYEKAPAQEWIDDLDREELRDEEYIQQQIGTGTTFDFGDVWRTIKSLFYFALVIVRGVVAIPYTLSQLGLSMKLALIISIPMYAAYMLGLAEWIGGRQTKGMY